jgi:hypothetical protein
MFTPEERTRLRDMLIAAARADARVVAAALTGSAALDTEDKWSDIDLAFAVAGDAEFQGVVANWTDRLYREHGAVDHVDLAIGNVIFRVFLLANTLQLDLAFWPAAEFRAIAPSFRLLFGTANEQRILPAPAVGWLIGMGWLHALHARSAIARGKVWQAEYMISGVRDHVLALACVRHRLPAHHGKRIDDLPLEATAGVADSLVRSLDPAELRRAFAAVTEALIAEIEHADAQLSKRLTAPLRELAQ